MEIVYEYGPEGLCPVQAEGTIDGYPFYFRARGERWGLHIAPIGLDPLHDDAECHYEEYDGVTFGKWADMGKDGALRFSAGYAEPDECREFIERVAPLVLAKISSPQPSIPQPESDEQKE